MQKAEKILIFGATSAIAYETAKLLAGDGASMFLCARNTEDLSRISADLTVRGAKEVDYTAFNGLDGNSVVKAIDACLKKFPDLDGILIAHGSLPDQQLCESDVDELEKEFRVNFISAAIAMTRMARHFEKMGRGTMVVISSVAGDRGRQSNYIYGAAKGALSVLSSGLRQRLQKSGVNVINVKPGFVDTPMTTGFKKNPLFAGPEQIAKGIRRAMEKGKSEVYLPWFWWWIMLIIRNMPDRIFNRLKL